MRHEAAEALGAIATDEVGMGNWGHLTYIQGSREIGRTWIMRLISYIFFLGGGIQLFFLEIGANLQIRNFLFLKILLSIFS